MRQDYTAKQDEVSSMMSRIAEQQGQEDMLELEVRDLRLERNDNNLRYDNEVNANVIFNNSLNKILIRF